MFQLESTCDLRIATLALKLAVTSN